MSFTETWLKDIDRDEHVAIDGFKLLRGDRNLNDTDKACGGGVCLYVNEKWCHPNNAVIKRHACSPNMKILTVSLRPYYLPREFSHVVCSTIYIPNRSVAKQGTDELCSAIHDIERANLDAMVIIYGDFNHASLKKSSVQYHQYVDCPTRGTATLDLIYSNVKGAYTASPLPQLGQADHNLVSLLPKYRPLVQRQKPNIVPVQQWNTDSLRELQASL